MAKEHMTCEHCFGDGGVHGKQLQGAGGDCTRPCPKCGGTGVKRDTSPLYTRPKGR